MELSHLVCGAFQANAWLLWEPAGGAVLVDPGDEADRIRAWAAGLGVQPDLMVATHGHLDHVAAAAELQAAWGVPFAIHPGDGPLLDYLPEIRRQYGLPPARPPRIDRELAHGELLRAGSLVLQVRHCPGHSPGGVVLVAAAGAFTGDTVFQGSVGRTDLPGGSWETLLASIQEQVLTLPDAARLFPGHGPETTVGAERRHNPFL